VNGQAFEMEDCGVGMAFTGSWEQMQGFEMDFVVEKMGGFPVPAPGGLRLKGLLRQNALGAIETVTPRTDGPSMGADYPRPEAFDVANQRFQAVKYQRADMWMPYDGTGPIDATGASVDARKCKLKVNGDRFEMEDCSSGMAFSGVFEQLDNFETDFIVETMDGQSIPVHGGLRLKGLLRCNLLGDVETITPRIDGPAMGADYKRPEAFGADTHMFQSVKYASQKPPENMVTTYTVSSSDLTLPCFD